MLVGRRRLGGAHSLETPTDHVQDREGRRGLGVLAALGKSSLQSRLKPHGEKERHLICLQGKGEVRKAGRLMGGSRIKRPSAESRS